MSWTYTGRTRFGGDDFREYIHTHTHVRLAARPASVLKKPQYPRRDRRYFRRSINIRFFFFYYSFVFSKYGIPCTLTGTKTTGNNNNNIHPDRHMLGWASLDHCTRERARTHARRKLKGTHTHERCIVSVSAHSSCNYVRFVFCFYFRYYSVFFSLVSFYQQLVAQQATTYISSYLRLALSEKPASNRTRPFKAAALIGLYTRHDFETGSRAGKVNGKVARMCSGACDFFAKILFAVRLVAINTTSERRLRQRSETSRKSIFKHVFVLVFFRTTRRCIFRNRLFSLYTHTHTLLG